MNTRIVLTGTLVFGISLISNSFAQDETVEKPPSLTQVLSRAYEKNASIASFRHSFEAEKSLVTSKATLDDPMIGVNTLRRGMNTQYGTISQKIRFPVKYFLQANAQSSRADSYKAELEAEKMRVRAQVSSLYYSLYSTQKIIQLTEANMQAVKEFARVAEKKYAAGKSPQADSMKAHFELTQLELDLIRLKQEEEGLQESLRAVVNDSELQDLALSGIELPTPTFTSQTLGKDLSALTAQLKNKSPVLKKEESLLEEAQHQSTLASWEFAPDFQLQYQQRISGEPADSKIYSIGITFPLWFWKKSAESSAAASREIAQEFRVTDSTRKLVAKVVDLRGKVEAGSKTLEIYKTSLIPQAQGAYNSSRAAYQANKTSFLDLLDSERSLYRVKTGFFRSLRQYVHQLGELESHLGFSVSNLESSEVSK